MFDVPLKNSWLFPAIEALHVVGLALLVGAISLANFTRLGLLRPGIAQLAYLHVSNEVRGRGVGGRLSEGLEELARAAGDMAMVVSATPSLNTVRFYMGRGYEPMAEPFPELYELEPDDVHLLKRL